MKRMLFNATHPEELRVAIVDGQKLLDLDIESAVRSERKGNIYKAVVTKVEPSLEAAFVDYGAEKHGFLPLKEIYREYFTNYDGRTPINNVKIDQVIKEGQQMIVQVDKDERGTKGAALTTFISLAGRFVVLMPNNPKGGGISRRISGDERAELRDALDGLNVPSEHAIIARTAGIGRSSEELQWDLDFLTKLWTSIEEAADSRKGPFLIYQESNLIVRTIRDHLSSDIAEIIIDDPEIFERAQRFMNQVMPHNLTRLKHYQDTIPLFSRYQIENQIESAFTRDVSLPSGGSIVIDHTEALISIDVNSARATRGGDIEETAFQTNLEAVEEVARQLRIRDIGGLVVIDLIDMTIGKNQRSVEARLKEALRPDRARVQVGKISRFGLLEMSRQRLRASISDANYRVCPRCSGTGTIRSVVSSSLNLLRLIEDEALKENTEAIQVALPLDMATYLLNEKRHELNQLEARLASRVIIVPSDELSSPHFELRRLRSDELDELGGVPSYKQTIEISSGEGEAIDSLKTAKAATASVEIDQISHTAPPPRVEPAAAPVASNQPHAGAAPVNQQAASSGGLLSRIARTLFGTPEKTETPTEKDDKQSASDKPKGRGQRAGDQRGGDQRGDGNQNRRGGQRSRGGRGGKGRGGRGGDRDQSGNQASGSGNSGRQGRGRRGGNRQQDGDRKQGQGRGNQGNQGAQGNQDGQNNQGNDRGGRQGGGQNNAGQDANGNQNRSSRSRGNRGGRGGQGRNRDQQQGNQDAGKQQDNDNRNQQGQNQNRQQGGNQQSNQAQGGADNQNPRPGQQSAPANQSAAKQQNHQSQQGTNQQGSDKGNHSGNTGNASQQTPKPAQDQRSQAPVANRPVNTDSASPSRGGGGSNEGQNANDRPRASRSASRSDGQPANQPGYQPPAQSQPVSDSAQAKGPNSAPATERRDNIPDDIGNRK